MRIAGIGLILVALAAPVSADDTADLTALVTKNITAIAANSRTDFDRTLVRDPFVFLPSTEAPSFMERFHGFHTYDAKHVIEKIVVEADAAAGTAWFHVQFAASYDVAMMGDNGNPIPRQHETLRAVGFALKQPKDGWRIAAVMYGHAIPDKTLWERASEDVTPPDKPAVKGERTSAEAALRWLGGHALAAAQSASPSVVVNGTAPAEYATGATATTLVKAWDKLGMWPIAVRGIRVGNHTIALVKAEVGLPVPKASPAKATRMRLGAIAIFDGKTWKWVSLTFFAWFDEDNYIPF